MTQKRNRLLYPSLFAGSASITAFLFLAGQRSFWLDDWLHLVLARAMPQPFLAFTDDLMLGAFFRPLGLVWWWLLAHLGGDNEAAFSVFAYLLHLGGAAALGLAARAWRDDKNVGWSAAILWLSSPFALASVSWFSCAYDLLATMFIGLALWQALLFARFGKRANLALAVLTTLFAAWSKESAYTLPLLAFPVMWSAFNADRRRIFIAAGALAATIAVAWLHRFIVLGSWLGGYREAVAEKASINWPAFAAAFSSQAPGWHWRAISILLVCVGLAFTSRETRKTLWFVTIATAIAALPALMILRTPSMLPVMPARYFALIAMTICLSLSLTAQAWPERRWLGAIIVALLAVGGLVSATFGAGHYQRKSWEERKRVETVLPQVQELAQTGMEAITLPPQTVGLDAATKALIPALIGKTATLNCGIATHVVLTPMQAQLLAPYWSQRMPRNPSSGFGLVWGEMTVTREQCKKLQPPKQEAQ